MTGQQQMLVGRGNAGEGAPQGQTGGVNANFNLDGTCSITTGVMPSPANWYSIAPQTGVGYGYFIKITNSSGNTFQQSGVVQPLSSYSAAINGIGTGVGTYQLSTSATGAPVVASGTLSTNNTI